MPKTGDLSLRTLLEKPLAMDHKVAQDTGSAMRGVATLFGELYVQLPQHGLKAVSAHLCQELAALLGYYLRLDAGMVYVRFQGWEVETTVVFLGLAGLLGLGARGGGRGAGGCPAAPPRSAP